MGTMRTIDNKLIAEFMGYEQKIQKEAGANLVNDVYVWYLKDIIYYYINEEYYREDYLKFHSDWNWLMKVIDKIESFEDENRCAKYNVNIEQTFVEITENQTSMTITEADANTKIRAIYIAVINFIKYYNNEN